MLIQQVLQTLTQILWVFSAFIMMPATIISLVFAKLTGQITGFEKDTVSPFQKGQPNPYVQTPSMPWYEEQKVLLNLETPEMEEKNVFEKPKPKLVKVVKNSPLIMTFTPETKPVKTYKMENKKEEKSKVETRGRPPTPVFKSVDHIFEAVVPKDFEGRTEDGIPFQIKEGTKIRVAVPSTKLPEILGLIRQEKKEKIQDLEEDEDLGAVVG